MSKFRGKFLTSFVIRRKPFPSSTIKVKNTEWQIEQQESTRRIRYELAGKSSALSKFIRPWRQSLRVLDKFVSLQPVIAFVLQQRHCSLGPCSPSHFSFFLFFSRMLTMKLSFIRRSTASPVPHGKSNRTHTTLPSRQIQRRCNGVHVTVTNCLLVAIVFPVKKWSRTAVQLPWKLWTFGKGVTPAASRAKLDLYPCKTFRYCSGNPTKSGRVITRQIKSHRSCGRAYNTFRRKGFLPTFWQCSGRIDIFMRQKCHCAARTALFRFESHCSKERLSKFKSETIWQLVFTVLKCFWIEIDYKIRIFQRITKMPNMIVISDTDIDYQ